MIMTTTSALGSRGSISETWEGIDSGWPHLLGLHGEYAAPAVPGTESFEGHRRLPPLLSASRCPALRPPIPRVAAKDHTHVHELLHSVRGDVVLQSGDGPGEGDAKGHRVHYGGAMDRTGLTTATPCVTFHVAGGIVMRTNYPPCVRRMHIHSRQRTPDPACKHTRTHTPPAGVRRHVDQTSRGHVRKRRSHFSSAGCR